MDIKRIGSQASAKGPAEYFTGSVRVDPLLAGHKVGPDFAVYAASKFAVRVLADGLRQEVKPYNIRTTVISPGAVATELPNSVTEPDLAKGIRQYYDEVAIPALGVDAAPPLVRAEGLQLTPDRLVAPPDQPPGVEGRILDSYTPAVATGEKRAPIRTPP